VKTLLEKINNLILIAVKWKDALDTLYLGLAVTVVSRTLIAFISFGHQN